MAQCARCSSRKLMRLPSRQGTYRWCCLDCGYEFTEEAKPLTLFRPADVKEAKEPAEAAQPAVDAAGMDRALISSLSALLVLDIDQFETVERTLEGCLRIRETLAEHVRQCRPAMAQDQLTEMVNHGYQILVSQDPYEMLSYRWDKRSQEEKELILEESVYNANTSQIRAYCEENDIEYVTRNEDRIYRNKVGQMLTAMPSIRGDIILLLDAGTDIPGDGARGILNALAEFDDPGLVLVLGVERDVRKLPGAALIRTRDLITQDLLSPCMDYHIRKKKTFLGKTGYEQWFGDDYYYTGDLIRCMEFQLSRGKEPPPQSIKHIDYLGFL